MLHYVAPTEHDTTVIWSSENTLCDAIKIFFYEVGHVSPSQSWFNLLRFIFDPVELSLALIGIFCNTKKKIGKITS